MRILPRAIGQLLNDSLASLGRTWRPLATIAVAVFIPAGLITRAVFQYPGALSFLEAVFERPEVLARLPPEVFLELARPFLLAMALTLAVQAAVSIYVFIVCHRATIEDIKGRPVALASAARPGAGRFLTAAGAGILSGLIASLAFSAGLSFWSVPAAAVGTPNPASGLVALVLLVALTAPGLWLGVSLSMVTAVAAVEGGGAISAMRRSLRLVRGRWWPSLGFLLVVGLLGAIAIQLVQLVAIPLAAVGAGGTGAVLASVVGVAAQGPIVVAMGVTFTHWYLDLRARRETLLAGQI